MNARCTGEGVRQCVQGRLPGGGGSVALGTAPLQLRVAARIQQHCGVFEGTWQAVSGTGGELDRPGGTHTAFLGGDAPRWREGPALGGPEGPEHGGSAHRWGGEGAALSLNGGPQVGSQDGQPVGRGSPEDNADVRAGVTAMKADLEDSKVHFGERLYTRARHGTAGAEALLKGKRRLRGTKGIRGQTLGHA